MFWHDSDRILVIFGSAFNRPIEKLIRNLSEQQEPISASVFRFLGPVPLHVFRDNTAQITITTAARHRFVTEEHCRELLKPFFRTMSLLKNWIKGIQSELLPLRSETKLAQFNVGKMKNEMKSFRPSNGELEA
jgi:hypothetical protein